MTGLGSRTRSRELSGASELPMLWIDGQRQRAAEASISALDRGLTLADGLFETMRMHRGVIFRLEQHLERLRHGCRRLRIPLPDVGAMLRSAVTEAARGGLLEASVRLTTTRGIGAPGVAPPREPRPTVVIAVNALPSSPASGKRWFTVRLACGRRNEHAPTAGLKTLAYTDSVLALMEARDAGADDAILLDTAGHLAEGTSSNLFIVSRGVLRTPPLSCGVLPGITRAAVLECARALGIATEERALLPDELRAASEAFLTSSVRGLMPIAIFEETPLGGEAPGPVTRRLITAYSELVSQECAP